MNTGFIAFVLVPLLLYTYFWINPTAYGIFLDGLSRYIVEIYLGYKEWKLERKTQKAYRYYLKESTKMAKERGLSKNNLNQYFRRYRKDDWNFLYKLEKEEFEVKNRDLENELKDLIAF